MIRLPAAPVAHLPRVWSVTMPGSAGVASLSRNDMLKARLASLRQLQSATGEELSPPLHFGDASQSALPTTGSVRAGKS